MKCSEIPSSQVLCTAKLHIKCNWSRATAGPFGGGKEEASVRGTQPSINSEDLSRKRQNIACICPVLCSKKEPFSFTHQMNSRPLSSSVLSHTHTQNVCSNNSKPTVTLHLMFNNLFPFRLGNKVIGAGIKKNYVGGDLTVFVEEESAWFKLVVTQYCGMFERTVHWRIWLASREA